MSTVYIAPLDAPISKMIPEGIMTRRELELMHSYQRMSQDVWVGIVDGTFVCTWGLVPPTLLSNWAYLWLYTTPAVREHQFLFVRNSQRMVEKMLDKYKTIAGHVRVDGEDSKRWLKWLGAEFGPPQGQMQPFRIMKKWAPHSH